MHHTSRVPNNVVRWICPAYPKPVVGVRKVIPSPVIGILEFASLMI